MSSSIILATVFRRVELLLELLRNFEEEEKVNKRYEDKKGPPRFTVAAASAGDVASARESGIGDEASSSEQIAITSTDTEHLRIYRRHTPPNRPLFRLLLKLPIIFMFQLPNCNSNIHIPDELPNIAMR